MQKKVHFLIAFCFCKSLNKINLPKEIIKISKSTFERCQMLESINIPATVEKIHAYAFSQTKILRVDIENIEAWLNIDFYIIDAKPSGALYLNNHLVTEITIPTSITKIKRFSFFGCYQLKKCIIPNHVTSIEERAFGAFACCNDLETCILPSTISVLNDSTFGGCESLKSIEIPASVQRIGKYGFYNCKQLNSVGS